MSYRILRWFIVALLFLATTINYVDRQTLSVLSPTLRAELKLTETDYANVVTAFLIPYTIMYSAAGRLIDLLGVRLGAALCLAWWSAATALTAAARGARSLALYRFLLGLGEPGIFPAGVKACAEWFPERERALPTGIFSSGSAVGAVLAPPLIALLTLKLGWRAAFLVPGAMGLLWLPFWLRIYHPPARHPLLSKSGFARFAPAAEQADRIPWLRLLKLRNVWALVLPRLASDPVWYFYVFWLPDYLQRERHLSLGQIAAYGWVPFLFADLGNVGGGALSDWLIRRGVRPAKARLILLGAVGCLAPFGALVGRVQSLASVIALAGLAAFLCQCWSTNVATLAADVTPRTATASVIGMMGTAGSLGGALFSQLLGLVISRFGYPFAFLLAATLHPLAAMTLILLLRAPGPRQAGPTQ